MYRTVTLVLLVCVMAWSADGLAKKKKKKGDDPKAKAATLYKEGTASFDAGEFEAALTSFTEAYNLSAETGLLYNLAVCAEKTGNTDKAIAYYELYLEENPEAEDTQEVKKRLELLQNPPAPVAEPAPEPEPEATPEPEPEDKPEPQPEEAAPVDLEGIDQGQEDTGPFGPGILIGTGGLILAGGLLTAISAHKKYGDLEDSCSPDCSDGDLKPTRNTALAADILMITGGIVVASGIIWWIMDARKEREGDPGITLQASPSVSPTGGGVFLEGSF